MIELSAKGLKLIPLNFEQLQIWHTQGREVLEKNLGLEPQRIVLDDVYQKETADALANYWLPQTAEHPTDYFWYTNWEIIHLSERKSVGGIGFGGYQPDASSMVGYIIYPPYREQGYAKQALGMLCSWAFANSSLEKIIAHTPKQNIASQKVLQANGFEQTGLGIMSEPPYYELIFWQKNR
jgi:[ribosomal protein S5]-alanine N-acetyltransferase